MDERCIGYARECVRLAGLTEDEVLREQLLNLARNWMATAMRKPKVPKSERKAPPPGLPGVAR
jgi:hypothetical protein